MIKQDHYTRGLYRTARILRAARGHVFQENYEKYLVYAIIKQLNSELPKLPNDSWNTAEQYLLFPYTPFIYSVYFLRQNKAIIWRSSSQLIRQAKLFQFPERTQWKVH